MSGNSAPSRVLLLLGAAAALLGLYARFKGIGTWPLGVDEFYISRSVDHILASGVPAFPCGGYYSRGLLFQYAVAALRLSGGSPEFAGRFVAALCGLAVLPAAYLFGKRAHGPLTGCVVVIVLLLSAWEIEMARFGRMYAPFQAVFAWYLLFYVRYTIDRNAAALRWMVALSLLGILTWEGGTLLGVANILAVLQTHEQGRLKAVDWRRLAGLAGLLALLYLASRDLRGVGAAALTEVPAPSDAPGPLHSMLASIDSLRLYWPWNAGYLVPLWLAAASARYIWSFRRRWMACVGLVAVLLAAAAHAFAAAAGLLALMLLIGLIDWRELLSRRATLFIAAVLAMLAFWLLVALAGRSAPLDFLFGFPAIFDRIGHPWGRAMPAWTAVIALSAAYWLLRSIGLPTALTASTAPPPGASAMRSSLALLLLLALAIGAIPTERIETRYTFFLYPMLLVMTVAAILELVRRLSGHATWPVALAAAAPLVVFAAGEDFQFRHITHIDSPQANYRLGMSSGRADHYYPRNDVRGIAQWLAEHARPGDVIVSGIPNLDQYYPRFDYFYLEEADNRYDAYLCADGRTDRWTNHPIISKPEQLESSIRSGSRVYATVYADAEQRLRHEALLLHWTVTKVYTAIDAKSSVLSIGPGAPAEPAR